VLDIKLSSYSPCLLLLNCLNKKGTCNVLQPCALPSSPPQLRFPPQSPFSCLTARSSPRSTQFPIHWRVQRPACFVTSLHRTASNVPSSYSQHREFDLLSNRCMLVLLCICMFMTFIWGYVAYGLVQIFQMKPEVIGFPIDSFSPHDQQSNNNSLDQFLPQ
jgi:hypothetical protein